MKGFLEHVVSPLREAASEMMESRVIPSLVESVRRNGANDDTPDDEALRVWCAEMLLRGLGLPTVKRYLGALHTEYKEWARTSSRAEVDPFKSILSDLGSLASGEKNFSRQNVAHLPRIVRMDPASDEWVSANVFLYLLYNPSATLSETIGLTREGHEPAGCAQQAEIVERMHAAPQSKYVFPLQQGRKRISRISGEVTSAMRRTLESAGMRFGSSFSRASVTSLWIEAAWKCGIGAREIRGVIGEIPAEHSFLTLVSAPGLDDGRQAGIVARVADSINDRTRRWFVMRLRSGVTPDDIRSALAASCPALAADLRLYYPTRRIVRRKDKRKIREDVPYLPGILFFMACRDNVGAMFRHIGHMAWCFRTANSPRSPYASISASEMKRFQQHVGQFTPDIETRLSGAGPVADVGGRVSIVGGDLYEGLEGEVLKVRRENGKVIYSLRLTGSLCIRWEGVEVEASLVEPVRSGA